MARLLPSKRTQREEETDEAADRELNLRTAVLGLAALAGGYLVGRRLWRGGEPSTGSLRERAGEALPGSGVDVPIGGDGEGTADEGGGGEGTADEGRDGGAESDEPAPGADPSLEEIDERTAADVEEEPAEPGEMQVDEDVVDEAVDAGDEDEA